jgi:uncharacterized protein
MNIIDSAVRLNSENNELKIQPCLDLMTKNGVAHSVIAPSDEFVSVFNEDGNQQIADFVKQYPDKLSGFAVANPWYGEQAISSLEKAFEIGLCGLYMHPGRQGFHLTDSIVDPLIETCINRDKPIYSYTGTPICSMPFQLAELARRFPDAKFVMGHMAYSDFCHYDVIRACEQAPNIMIETSCAPGEMIKMAINELGAERILFGSGHPRSTLQYEIKKLEILDLPDSDFQAVVCTNAQKLWGIK